MCGFFNFYFQILTEVSFLLQKTAEGADGKGNAYGAERDHNDPKRCHDRPAEIFRHGAENAELQREAEACCGVQHTGGRSVFAVFCKMHIVVLGEKGGWRESESDHRKRYHHKADRKIANEAKHDGKGKRKYKHHKEGYYLIFEDSRENEEANQHRSRNAGKDDQRVEKIADGGRDAFIALEEHRGGEGFRSVFHHGTQENRNQQSIEAADQEKLARFHALHSAFSAGDIDGLILD